MADRSLELSAPGLSDAYGIWQESVGVMSCSTHHDLAADGQLVQQRDKGCNVAPGHMWHKTVLACSPYCSVNSAEAGFFMSLQTLRH